LTDGEVGNETEILKAVRANVKDSRFFCFGVGSSVNHYLIQGIGKHGRGAASTVLTNSLSNAEELRKPIDEFIGFIDAPVLTDITIDWGGLDVTDPNPELIADVFKGKPVTVIAQYHTAGSGVITINARKGGVPWSYTIPVTLPFNEPDNAALAPIWARAKIERLTDERVLSTEERSAQIGEEIIQTALDFRLVSEGTSFVAVDDMTIIGAGRPRTVKVAVDKPLDHAGE
ncbi:MAG: hypothetical protein HUU29_13575, partial [Planctomycetaceae bacterium]|nr:hypothetical protein [Planctomycetaceae bacterium]